MVHTGIAVVALAIAAGLVSSVMFADSGAVLAGKLYRAFAVGMDRTSDAPRRGNTTAAANANRPVLGNAVFAMFDSVGLYQKNGLVEVYGGELRQRQSGPITVEKSLLLASGNDAWVLWSPDASPAADATGIELRLFGALPAAATLTVGLILHSGTSFAFETGSAPVESSRLQGFRPAQVPEPFRDALASAKVLPFARGAPGVWSVKLPPELTAELRQAPPPGAIRTWFVVLSNAAGSTLEVASLALVANEAQRQDVAIATVSGRVRNIAPAQDATVELVTESNKRYSAAIAEDGSFAFNGLAPGRPVSLRFRHLGQNYYANLGRWFSPMTDRTDIVIAVVPSYVNADNHPADPKKAKFIHRSKPVSYFSYEPHSRQYWPGAGPVQEFDSTTFSNNYGLIDRDRFFDNPDRCFRIAHLGASTAVSLQVRAFEKYNMVLEQELGVALGRCVEVVSVGRDNGDIGALFRAARDYAIKFAPDVLLIENSNYHLMQIHPELLRRAIGWDQTHSPLDSFYYDDAGKLRLREESNKYPLFVTPPNQAELVPGVNFWKTMMVPHEHMHRYGREAWKYFVDIVRHYQEQFPGPRIVVNTGLDQAQCKNECETRLMLADGKQIVAGTRVLLDHYRKLCEKEKLDCINPDIPAGYEHPPVLLTFVHDGHFSVRGHQWYARELAKGIEAIYR
ncbi:MAG: carboxypeptidase regulatory-like domain-containing protein [Burkholderiales bacterium]|nr:carboxypeptidase regulatory-like domain-containing protein [Burkholderiales bacterium]